MSAHRNRMIAFWLFACAALVFAMITIGAITRLTESGLSITEWKPVTGALPPLDAAQWQRSFDLYRQSPEFQKKHFWMELADYKKIYFWEWLHRLLGRLIGIAYALPFVAFLACGWIEKRDRLKLGALFALGGMQGAMGWYMVKSGLVDIPAVSHFRLAAHLGLALVIYALMVWHGLGFLRRGAATMQPESLPPGLLVHLRVFLGIVALTICWGAFVAGLDAGLIYNTFPLMNGHVVAPDAFALTPAWLNVLENPAAVQFVHRWLGILTALAGLALWARAVRANAAHPGIHAAALIVLCQAALGIATLLTQVYLPLAALHQAGAVVLLTAVIYCLRREKFSL